MELQQLINNWYLATNNNDYDLAAITGISPQLINYYRNGKRYPKISNLRKICEAIGIKTTEVKMRKKPSAMEYMLDDGAYAPEKAHEQDAGLDLRTPFNAVVPARNSAVIDTGVHIKIPVGCVGLIKSKSGLNVKHGLRAEGVIDAGYTGSIVVKMYNDSDVDYSFRSGDKVTQLVILPILTGYELCEVDRFEQTERGANGFGSSGR